VEADVTEQTGTERVTRLVRCRTLTNGAIFIDPQKRDWGECAVLDVEVHDDAVSALVLTGVGEQQVFERTGWSFVELVVG
jgi:hypothetical protein